MRLRGLHQFIGAAQQTNFIERWNNKPNLLPETVAAHSFLVAIIVWGMAAANFQRQRVGSVAGAAATGDRTVDTVEVLKRAIAHDLHEVVIGDILSPTKRAAKTMKRAVERLERRVGRELVRLLPAMIQDRFEPYVVEPMDTSPEGRLVKTADLFAAQLKAWLEVEMGNGFHRADLVQIRRSLRQMHSSLVEELLWELGDDEEPPETTVSLAGFLRILFSLYYVKRWNNLPTLAPKSVAAHAHLVAFIAWLLAETENAFNRADLPVGDVIKRALLLEAPKAITGDILYVSRMANRSMQRGVDIARARAARELLALLPPDLQPAFGPYLQPLAGPAEQIVDDAGRLAGYMEALMEVRLGNSYFHPILEALADRLESPFPTTRQLLNSLRTTPETFVL